MADSLIEEEEVEVDLEALTKEELKEEKKRKREEEKEAKARAKAAEKRAKEWAKEQKEREREERVEQLVSEQEVQIMELIKEARVANTELKSFLEMKKVTMNLQEINATVDPTSQYESPSIQQEMITKWVLMSDQYKDHLMDRIAYEKRLVEEMNEWVGEIHGSGKESFIMCRVPDKEGYYGFVEKSVNGFKEMMKTAMVYTYDRKDFQTILHLDTDPSWNELNRTKIRQLVPRNPDGTYKKLPTIKPQYMSLAEIYLSHPLRSTYTGVVFNPRPFEFKKGASESELNTWGGHVIKRDDVINYTNWELIFLLMNHMRFTW